MKKEFILALSILLTSVTASSLTSCNDDDKDDANHTPLSVMIEDNKEADQVIFRSGVMGYAYNNSVDINQIDSIKAVVAAKLQLYFESNLDGLAEKVNTSDDFITIIARSSNAAEIASKLKAMNSDRGTLENLFSNTKGIGAAFISLRQDNSTDYVFKYTYKGIDE